VWFELTLGSGDFDDSPESVQLEFSDPGEYRPMQIISASAVIACD
jgi:hypothetical protein